MTRTAPALLLRLAPSIYGPTILFTLGEAAIMPLIPILATELGASLALSGLIASALVVGQLAGNLPASWVVSRAGERVAMLLASGVALLGTLGLVFAPNLALLAAAVFVIGFAAATFGLARHSFMATRVAPEFRARALSLLGGSNRLGRFGGPFLTAALLAATGSNDAPIWAFAACLLFAGLLVGFAPDPERIVPRRLPDPGASGREAPGRGASGREATKGGILAALRDHRDPLIRVGACAAVLSGLRSIKDVLLPLWGVSIGMDATGVAIVMGISGTIDFALFYTSGQVMDRFGRLWAALPATGLMAVSFLVLAGTHDLARPDAWLIACGVLIGIGNGLSSGIVLTLGADLAPPGDPAPFLAVWRTLVDTGGAVLPLAVSGLAALSLPFAAAATGAFAVAGTAGFARWIPRYIPRLRRKR